MGGVLVHVGNEERCGLPNHARLSKGSSYNTSSSVQTILFIDITPDRYTTPHGDKYDDSQSPISSAYGNDLTSPTTTNVGAVAVSSETAYEVKHVQ